LFYKDVTSPVDLTFVDSNIRVRKFSYCPISARLDSPYQPKVGQTEKTPTAPKQTDGINITSA